MSSERPQALSLHACRCHLCKRTGAGPRALTGFSRHLNSKQHLTNVSPKTNDSKETKDPFTAVTRL